MNWVDYSRHTPPRFQHRSNDAKLAAIRYDLLATTSFKLEAFVVRTGFCWGISAILIVVTGSLRADSTSKQTLSQRTTEDLIAIYDFASPTGTIVKDRSGTGVPLDLRITNPQGVRRHEGYLELYGDAYLVSNHPPIRLQRAIQRSGEITVEAWIRSTDKRQRGPARIVTLSRDGSHRNFTLGQKGDTFDFRLRTPSTSSNGLPSLSTPKGSVHTNLTHVVYTRSRDGAATIYLNGIEKAANQIGGSFINWDHAMRLGLGNEHGGGRQWHGEYHLVAIYASSLSPAHVKQNFNAGHKVQGASLSATLQNIDTRAIHFREKIAPLLSDRCLECHDTATHEGGLDLSRKETAFAGGDNGQVLTPGLPSESRLWELVKNDDMPADREPLTDIEKKLIRNWISEGSVWSVDPIDPAVYVHGAHDDQNWVRRLTVSEYVETVRAAVGVDIRKEATELLPPDLRADGFRNTAYNLNVDLKHVETYARLAELIVKRMDINTFAAQFIKQARFTDKAMGELIANMGMWLLRGPIEEHEIIAYRGISTSVASTGGTYELAVGLIIEAMLQSPRFMYRVENQRGDGQVWPVTEYELASRLSYMLWGGPPDQELLRSAEQGHLYDRDDIAAQIDRMLDDSRTIDHSLRFISEWLNLDRLSKLQPNGERFPAWSDNLAADMREETLKFFKEIVWRQRRPMSDLVNAQVTFATPRLAAHYGLAKEHATETADDFWKYELADIPTRGGLLTQGSVLTIGGDEASMVTRGLFVMHELLRGVVKDPPPCVDTTPIPTKVGLSQRGIAMERIANATCGGCHAKFEPLAFGLEKYDGIGGFHLLDEHSNTLREDGEILIPGQASASPFQTAAEMMNLLANSQRVKHSMTWKLTQFCLGRPLTAADAEAVKKIHNASQANDGTYTSLIKAIALSDLVQLTPTETDPLK